MTSKIVSRLRAYWKMEVGCALALPAVGFMLIRQSGDSASLWTIAAMAAASGLLIVGAACWRMELARATGNNLLAARIMRWLGPSRPIGLALAMIGAVAAGVELWREGGFTSSAIAALIFGGLAVLEYVNYYVVQLQHFDHWADFKRLISGKGFRRPHLARSIEQWRRELG